MAVNAGRGKKKMGRGGEGKDSQKLRNRRRKEGEEGQHESIKNQKKAGRK